MKKYTFDLKKGKVKIEEDVDMPFLTDSDDKTVVEDQNDNDGGVTEDLANCIDWVKLTKNFNLERIKDIVKTIGRNKRDKKIIIKAIYDAESATGEMYKIPYSVDKLLNDLYKENDENHKGLFDVAYDEKTETLNLDILMKHAIDEYMKKHTATDKDIDDIIFLVVDEFVNVYKPFYQRGNIKEKMVRY